MEGGLGLALLRVTFALCVFNCLAELEFHSFLCRSGLFMCALSLMRLRRGVQRWRKV